MNDASDPIDLGSDDEEGECVQLDSDNEEPEDLGENWVCRHCTLTNPPYAGDCSACGEPNDNASKGGAAPGDHVIDLTAPGPTLSAQTESYVKASKRSEDSVALDNCSCTVNRKTLQKHVLELAQSLPGEAAEVDEHFCCPIATCQKLLTRRDLVSMIDSQTCHKVDQHIYKVMQQEISAPKDSCRPWSGRHSKKHKTSASFHNVKQALSLASTIRALQAALGVPIESSAASKENGSADIVAEGKATGRATRAATAESLKGKDMAAALAAMAAVSGDKGKGLAKGTGYGGERDGGYLDSHYLALYQKGKRDGQQNTAAQNEVQKAQEKEAKLDKAAQEALQDIKACIDSAAGRTSRNLLQSPSMLMCGTALGGPLAFLLHSLLQNDSLMDIGRRSDLYWALVRLVQSLGRCVDFIPLFLKPADLEAADSTKAGGQTMLGALRTLDIQCRVFKRNAEDLSYSEEEIRALSLALEINNSYEELQKAADVLTASHKRLEASLADLDPLTPSSAGVSEAEDQASIERRYCTAVGGYRLRQWPLVTLRDFYFRKEAEGTGAFKAKKSLLRIGQEMSSLATSLPVAWATSVFLVSDETRMDIIRTLIVGPEGTPYENGIYLFDILLPPTYPETPPKVQFLTTGGGTVRFNPNLYNCGKVCLSLLGTWSGPSWDPANSTLLQVLVSIQSMIFIADPYFNEPGHESSAGSPHGQAQSAAYNRNIRVQNLRHALLPALQKPPPAFKDLLRTHFRFKYNAILKQMEEWEAADRSLQTLTIQVREHLEEYRTKEGLLLGT